MVLVVTVLGLKRISVAVRSAHTGVSPAFNSGAKKTKDFL